MRELSNSIWCIDKSGRLGMIVEINSNQALFCYEGKDGALDPTPALIAIDELAQASAAQVPVRLGFTAQQLADMGYSSAPPAASLIAPAAPAASASSSPPTE